MTDGLAIDKVKVPIKNILFTFFLRKFKQITKFKEGFFKNPLFYFGVSPFILFGLLFSSSEGLAQLSYTDIEKITFFNSFFKNTDNSEDGDPFFNQNKALAIETPDLIIQDNFVYAISTPRVLTTQTLGSIFGGYSRRDEKEVIEYSVQPGDTIETIAQQFNISVNTALWANDLSGNSALKAGQTLTILPVSGLIHPVKSGDTISEIGKIYKADKEEIITFNNLTNEGDIFIGDILIIPGGVMPAKPLVSIVAPLADNFFIYPAEGTVTQRTHYYNAVDVANKCGTSVYAAASGVAQRARYGWNSGGGNQITILHARGVVTYYGHLVAILVKPGDTVDIGQRIGLMGTTGVSTGCHLHFGVIGAKNPLSKYPLGATLKYK